MSGDSTWKALLLSCIANIDSKLAIHSKITCKKVLICFNTKNFLKTYVVLSAAMKIFYANNTANKSTKIDNRCLDVSRLLH